MFRRILVALALAVTATLTAIGPAQAWPTPGACHINTTRTETVTPLGDGTVLHQVRLVRHRDCLVGATHRTWVSRFSWVTPA